jgi:hypothetical protein
MSAYHVEALGQPHGKTYHVSQCKTYSPRESSNSHYWVVSEKSREMEKRISALEAVEAVEAVKAVTNHLEKMSSPVITVKQVVENTSPTYYVTL